MNFGSKPIVNILDEIRIMIVNRMHVKRRLIEK